LIVDDNEADVASFTRMLRQQFGEQVRVQNVDTGAAAIEMLRHEAIDVTLIDYRLPDMDGFQILKDIASSAVQTAPILLTGQGSETVAAQAIKQGARDYLVKRDVTGPALRSAIGQALETGRVQVQSAHSVQQLLRTHHEFDHVVKSLSHDMTANFHVLETCIRQLKNSRSLQTSPDLLEGMSHVEACLSESKLFLNDLATLAKTGQIDMTPARVEMSHVVADVLFELQGLLALRKVKTDVAAGLPLVWCNETRVRQVLSNLVRNAVIHGCDAHRPQITISQVEPWHKADRDFVWLQVFDNGPGIPAKYREEVFRPGRRLAGARSSGTGMGLAIVKQIVDYYGGMIFVDPSQLDGTAFLFSLPIVPAAATS